MNDYLAELGVVYEILVDLGYTAESEMTGRAQGHVENQTLAAVVGNATDCIVLDSTGEFEIALEGVELHDSRELAVSVKDVVHRLQGHRSWLYSLKLRCHCH